MKLESMLFVQKHFTLFMRNKKVADYIAATRWEEYKKELKYIAICLVALMLCFGIFVMCTPEPTVTCPVVATHTEYVDEREFVYLVCEMPNGEVHEYSIEDAMENITSVTFKTKGSKNYATYEIIETN